MKKEFKNVALEVMKLKKTDIIATSCPLYCGSDGCTTDVCGDDV